MKKEENFWRKYFKVYDTLNLLIPYRDLLNNVVKELEIRKGEKIFEGGCGTGNLLLKIKKKGADVIGLDFSKEALDILKKKDNEANVILGDLSKRIPFKDDYFDKVVLNNVLYLFPKNKQVGIIKELKRIIKPGGEIVIANPRKGWSPLKIYKRGIKDNLKEEGVIKTIIKIAKMILPTIRIMYYNFFIKKGSNYYFPSPKEQKDILKEGGFMNISETKFAYAGQGIINSAKK